METTVLARDETGRFISRNCPECGNGILQRVQTCPEIYPLDFVWECDGLVDPEYPHQPLERCCYSIDEPTHYIRG